MQYAMRSSHEVAGAWVMRCADDLSVSLVEEKVQPQPASSLFRSTALMTLPLWATATSTSGPLDTIGWALAILLEPVVEYRVCPMARWPVRLRKSSSLNACATRPIAVQVVMRPPSAADMPALSWPRCWRANSPKKAIRAASESRE